MTAVRESQGSLTDEQLQQYETEGYVILRQLLDSQDLAPCREAMSHKVSQIADALFREGLISDKLADRPFESRLAELFAGLSDREFLKFGRSWRDRFPGYYVLMSNPKILDAVESLIGGEIFSNPVYNVRPKVPHVAAGAVPWHQDKSYWPGATANPVITCWIPFVSADLINGCVHLIPRTHHNAVLPWHAETYSGTGYTEVDIKDRLDSQAVPMLMAAGDALLFNDRLLHMSTPNRSAIVRWSVDLRYQPTDQDPMPQHGIGFLARSRKRPERIATLADWLAGRPEHET